MSTQFYVLAKCGEKQELVSGTFGGCKAGDKFERDPLTGGVWWEIIKIFNHEQQMELQAIERLMGTIGLHNLFLIK